jgi:hypothetical protein
MGLSSPQTARVEPYPSSGAFAPARFRRAGSAGGSAKGLPGCVKVYLPPPGGPLGIVYRLAKNKDGRLYLDHLAFGVRHHPPGSTAESVYRMAHQGLHRANS